jgi:hypothetical protein
VLFVKVYVSVRTNRSALACLTKTSQCWRGVPTSKACGTMLEQAGGGHMKPSMLAKTCPLWVLLLFFTVPQFSHAQQPYQAFTPQRIVRPTSSATPPAGDTPAHQPVRRWRLDGFDGKKLANCGGHCLPTTPRLEQTIARPMAAMSTPPAVLGGFAFRPTLPAGSIPSKE